MRYYQETCKVESNGVAIDADILSFKPEKYIVCSLNKSIKVSLNYNEAKGIYAGRSAGILLTSNGPKEN